MTPKKSGLALLLAMGIPQSQTDSGMATESQESPDQGSDAMSTQMPMEAEEPTEEGEDMLDIPKGFKPPGTAADGGMFTTTIRAQIVDGKLKVLAVGDMPLKAEAGSEAGQDEIDSAAPSDEQPDQSQQPALDSESGAYAKRKKDEMAARKAMQPNR